MDIAYLTEILEAILTETGVYSNVHNLALRADVHVTAQTEFGEVNEVFSQTLNSALGGGIIQWEEQLEKIQPGSVNVTGLMANPNRYLGLSFDGAKRLSATLTGSFTLLFLVALGLYLKTRPPELSWIDKEASKVHSKYKKWVTEITNQTPIEADKIVSVGSIDGLVKIATELLKPILHQAPNGPQGVHSYFVFDDATRYEYLLGKEVTR